jgi:cytochrome b involved in lipid metabolism
MKLAVLLLAVVLLLVGCVSVNPLDLKAQASHNPPVSQNPTPSTSNFPQATPVVLSMEEVAKHNSASDCWMVINNKVYDLTDFVTHPGGSTYAPYCGTDGTEGYNTKGNIGNGHSNRADSMLPNFFVGDLGQQVTPKPVAQATGSAGTTNSYSSNYGWDD